MLDFATTGDERMIVIEAIRNPEPLTFQGLDPEEILRRYHGDWKSISAAVVPAIRKSWIEGKPFCACPDRCGFCPIAATMEVYLGYWLGEPAPISMARIASTARKATGIITPANMKLTNHSPAAYRTHGCEK